MKKDNEYDISSEAVVCALLLIAIGVTEGFAHAVAWILFVFMLWMTVMTSIREWPIKKGAIDSSETAEIETNLSEKE
jgi:hypothetical protein